VIVAAPALLLGAAAGLAFAIRKRLPYVSGLTLGAIAIAIALVATHSDDATGELLGVSLRLSPLARLATAPGTLGLARAYVDTERPGP